MPKQSEYVSALVQSGIESGKYPKRLYKYRTLESAVRSLSKPSIYLSSVLKFNDPYEGHFELDPNNTEQEWLDFITRYRMVVPVQAQPYAQRLSKDYMKAESIQMKAIKNVLGKCGVFCFSTKNKSLLMWSYYSEDHAGVCVEYDPSKDAQLRNILLPVKYSNDFVKFNYLRQPERATDAILQKAKCWAHEKEFRIVRKDEAGSIIKLNPQAITSVIFGCNFDFGSDKETKKHARLRKRLIKLLKMPKYKHVKIKQCELLPNKYKLRLKSIKL